MEKKLRVGIVGCGGIATQKHLPALAAIQEVEVVAFCDLILEKAQEAKEEFGTADAKVCTDYKELAADKDIDVIHVCTPNSSHSEISVAALMGGKHVCCEKPMAINSAEAKAMVDAAKASGKKLTIGYQNRHSPDTSHLKKICAAGELGEIYYAKAYAVRRRAVPTWGVFLDKEKQGGGPLIDIGTHALDLTLWCMDNYEPKMVVGSTFYKLGKQKNAGNAWGDWDTETFDVEDSAVGFIVMKNGATVVLEASWALNTLDTREAQCTLCGTLAGADMDDGLRINKISHNRQTVETPNLKAGGVAYFSGDDNDRPGFIEARLWINAILNDTDVVVKPEQAYVVTQILEAVYESAKTGQPVYF